MLPRSAAAATEQTQHQHPTSTSSAQHPSLSLEAVKSTGVLQPVSAREDRIGRARGPHTLARTAALLSGPPSQTCNIQRPPARHTASAAAAVIDGPSLVYMYFGARYLPGSLASPLFAWNSTTLPPAARSFLGGTNPSRCLAGQTKDGRLATRVLPLHAGPIRHPECSGRSSPE